MQQQEELIEDEEEQEHKEEEARRLKKEADEKAKREEELLMAESLLPESEVRPEEQYFVYSVNVDSELFEASRRSRTGRRAYDHRAIGGARGGTFDSIRKN